MQYTQSSSGSTGLLTSNLNAFCSGLDYIVAGLDTAT